MPDRATNVTKRGQFRKLVRGRPWRILVVLSPARSFSEDRPWPKAGVAQEQSALHPMRGAERSGVQIPAPSPLVIGRTSSERRLTAGVEAWDRREPDCQPRPVVPVTP